MMMSVCVLHDSLVIRCPGSLLVSIPGVMQATTMGGAKLDKRYSPSFREDAAAVPVRKMSASKRKRDEVLRWVHP